MSTKYKYRFKTESELIKEFGKDRWEILCGMNNEGYMNYLLGSKIDIPKRMIDRKGDVIKSLIVNNECPYYDGQGTWSISTKLITKYNASPTYKPKKFVY